jgi:diguanylate cyclase (GGDEF)-like protein/PAS domain S-box-containing protein
MAQTAQTLADRKRLRKWFWSDPLRVTRRDRWLIKIVLGVAGTLIVLRGFGIFQLFELTAYDQLLQKRPPESQDTRITLVTIDDRDLKHLGTNGILPDQQIAQAISRIKTYKPRAIGLDIYRDLPVNPGHDQLEKVFQTTPQLISIEKLPDSDIPGVGAPPALQQSQQVGFNNVVIDLDGLVRRNTLFLKPKGQPVKRSFALKLALKYLEPNHLKLGTSVSKNAQINGVELPPLSSNDGAYINADTQRGYQILSTRRNSPNSSRHLYSFDHLPISHLLASAPSPHQQSQLTQKLTDRIVLIGITAQSSNDFFLTSYSSRTQGNADRISGIELQGQFISQILSAALNRRSLIRFWNEPAEWLWILFWSAIGAILSWKIRAPQNAALGVLLAAAALLATCSFALNSGWWLPLVPPFLALFTSATGATAYFSHLRAELKKSKEFFSSIINTIPDPVYVKDHDHHWVVLNDAYCTFIGHPRATLINQIDYNFFPPHQAAHFWHQDELTFKKRIEQECEEEFTNAQGKTYLVATKRSLHTDSAGNLFLVGVIRDITQRKQMEEALRSTADELVRSNSELAQAKDLLAHIAYHDPLTNLPNRKRFHEQLQLSLDRAKEQDHWVALLFLDLDGFKQINDLYGHQVGDLLLKAVAQRLTNCLRNSDVVARLGGDEFVAILPSIPSIQDVCRVADKILQTLDQSFVFEGKIMSISVSIGISIYPTDCNETGASELENFLNQADTAMYRAKKLGKNRYEFFHPSIPIPAAPSIDIAVDSPSLHS